MATVPIVFGSLSSQRLFDRVLFLAHCSRAAYEDNASLYTSNLGMPLESFRLFEDEARDTAGFAACSDGHVIVAFRGTFSIKNLTTNLNVGKREACLGRVHTGFDNAAVEVLDLLLTELESLVDANQTVWFTGHSLGGAVALLAAKRLVTESEHGFPTKCVPSYIVTFGAPKVGDKGFAERCPLSDKIIPIVNEGDLVPYMPPIKGWNYEHVRGTYHYRLSKDYWKRLRLEGSMTTRLYDQCKEQWPKLKSVVREGRKNHSIRRYIEYVANNCEKSP